VIGDLRIVVLSNLRTQDNGHCLLKPLDAHLFRDTNVMIPLSHVFQPSLRANSKN